MESMFAVLETGGKQYKVSAGEKLKIEKLKVPEEGKFEFDKVLMVAHGDTVKVGNPYLNGAKVAAEVLRQGRHEKQIVFKYHSKTRERKKKGHRQPFTEVKITDIKF